jgi:hypothetical protein
MIPKLMSTNDYARFELCPFNRSVAKTNSLRESMKQHGFIPAYPIHCEAKGSRLLIKAGHHRFEVARGLGIPVFYVVSDDTATIHELERATNRWTVNDYLESHVGAGYEDYARLKLYHERTGIPLGMCVSMLSGESASSCNKLQDFKDGNFRISGEDHANQVSRIVVYCKSLDVQVNQNFIAAISRCLRVEEFSGEAFLVKIERHKDAVKKCRTVKEQMQHFEEIYNYKSLHQHRLSLCFLADKVMQSRSCLEANKKKSRVSLQPTAKSPS